MNSNLSSISFNNVKHQRGAALIVAMLVLSLIVSFAVTMTVEYHFSLKRINNQIKRQQAMDYLRVAEQFAAVVLLQDMEQDAGVTPALPGATAPANQAKDDIGEFWNGQPSATGGDPQKTIIPLDEDGDGEAETLIEGRIIDLASRFNVNNLRSTVANGFYTPYQAIFIRLLQTFQLDGVDITQPQAVSITNAIVDWLDAGQNDRNDSCGEDYAYQGIEERQPHLTPDHFIYSESELMLVCNMPKELYDQLRPFITVWPNQGPSEQPININTPLRTYPAAPGYNLLRALWIPNGNIQAIAGDTDGLLTGSQIPPLIDAGDVPEPPSTGSDRGFDTVAEANNNNSSVTVWPIGQGSTGFSMPTAGFGNVYSNYFLLEARITGEYNMTMASVISRDGGIIRVYSRLFNVPVPSLESQ